MEIKYSPMIEQYLEIKNEYKDYIIFYRVGDFYEMFFDDALLGSRILELALTGKDAGVEERVPMCGVPYHACDQYAEKLVKSGYKIAIVEQIEDPKLAKGLVKRGVIKIITPGTIESGLDDKENNFIANISYVNREYALTYLDITTGEGYIASYKNTETLLNEIISLKIKEIVLDKDLNNKKIMDFIKANEISLSYIDNFNIPESLSRVVINIDNIYHKGVGILIQYFIKTQMCEPTHFKPFNFYDKNKYLHLDAFTKKNLELTETLRLSNKNGSLLWLIDKCNTAMGSRLLHKWIDKPLVDVDLINERLDFVEAFNNDIVTKEEIKSGFKNVYDLERIISRIASGNANAKDLVWLRRSLTEIPNVKNNLSNLNLNKAKELADEIDSHNELFELLSNALVNDPPLSIKEGGLIKEGFNSRLDEIRDVRNNGKNWILNYEKEIKEKTGLKTLKVGYNRVYGYYVEITKASLRELEAPLEGFERRATITNAERFITPELKHYEDMILNAKEQIESLEYELFCFLRDETKKYIESLQELASIISVLDCYISLSDISTKYNYVRPTFNTSREVNIVDGRHPVLESVIGSNYIVNDCVINKYNMIIITGPNMSGKSTYMRMLACIIILAQIGSFVPAKSANLMIFDSIFTRIGASDDLVSGQSTFMVEMTEANYAISNATKNSLVLFDEIGRGTATFDGMALAQSILEYLHEKVGCITLFSTHYHELTALDTKLKRLKNVHVEAKDINGDIKFLHKVLDGPTDKSYGINVASLAGLPKSLIERSKQLLDKLETENQTNNTVTMDLFNFDSFDEKEEVKEDSRALKIKKRLDEIDIDRLSARDALNLLYELKEL